MTTNDLRTSTSFKQLHFSSGDINWGDITTCMAGYPRQQTTRRNVPCNTGHLLEDMYIDNVPKRKLWKQSTIPRDRRILVEKRCEPCKKLSRVNEIRHRAKIENKLTKLEKDILLSFENERNLNESLAVSAIKSNPKYFYTYAKNNAKVKAKIGPLIKTEAVISDPKSIAEVLFACIVNLTRTA